MDRRVQRRVIKLFNFKRGFAILFYKSLSDRSVTTLICVQGWEPCGGNVSLRSFSLEKAFCSGKGLLKYCAQQIFVSWLLYPAPMICAQAKPHFTSRSILSSIPAMILTSHSNRSHFSETGTRTHALRSLPITIGLNELTSAFRAGANGYFVNVITCDRFIRSVELVMMGETIFPPAFLSFILDANRPHLVEAAASDRNGEPILFATEDATAPLLSPREKVILRCIIEGDSNKCIARKIDIAEATVKVHVKAILRKIRVQNRTQAAIWGINNGSHIQPEVDRRPCAHPSPAEAKVSLCASDGRLREG